MSDLQAFAALVLWRAWLDTLDIARLLGVDEAIVARVSAAARAIARKGAA